VGGPGGVNGEANELNDYAAKTHELQTIIEKQVRTGSSSLHLIKMF